VALRIVIDTDRCVGSGNCLYWAPATFDLGDDGIAVVLDPEGDDEERIRVAEEGCPTRAITVGPGEPAGRSVASEAQQRQQEHGQQAKIEDQGGSHADRTD
jgi:ferredoxin